MTYLTGKPPNLVCCALCCPLEEAGGVTPYGESTLSLLLSHSCHWVSVCERGPSVSLLSPSSSSSVSLHTNTAAP